MTTSPDATGRVREHFRRKAFSFDHLYDEEHALQRLLRPGLFNRREFALAVAREHEAPSVLDVGGGSARVLSIDPRRGTVTTVARLPEALADPAAVSLHGRVFVLGGGTNAVYELG